MHEVIAGIFNAKTGYILSKEMSGMLPTLLCVYKGETKQLTKMGERKACGKYPSETKQCMRYI